jgi:hypothetical protein
MKSTTGSEPGSKPPFEIVVRDGRVYDLGLRPEEVARRSDLVAWSSMKNAAPETLR